MNALITQLSRLADEMYQCTNKLLRESPAYQIGREVIEIEKLIYHLIRD
jgi:hypothetical protein